MVGKIEECLRIQIADSSQLDRPCSVRAMPATHICQANAKIINQKANHLWTSFPSSLNGVELVGKIQFRFTDSELNRIKTRYDLLMTRAMKRASYSTS